MLPAALAEEFARDALLTHDGMQAAGIGTRVVADSVRRGEIVRVARNLCLQRGKDSYGWLNHAIACQISGGVLRGPTAGTIHGLTDDTLWGIHVLVPESKQPQASGDLPLRAGS